MPLPRSRQPNPFRWRFLTWWLVGMTLFLVGTVTPRSFAQANASSLGQSEADEAEKARGLTLTGIEVAGNRRISRDDVIAYLKEQLGKTFSPEALAQDVRELWVSGFFDDISVDLDRSDSGVNLRFTVRERPSIKAVEFKGNKEVESDDIKEAIEVKADSILSQAAITRSIQKIRDMYAEKGYFLAEAESSTQSERNNEVTVTFTVTEHARVSVRRVTLIGNNSIPESDIRGMMFTGQSSILSFGSGGPFRQDAFERDVALLSAMYYDRGFLTVQVHTPRVMLTPDRTGIELSITINEGPRFKIRQFRLYERGPGGREVEPIGGRKALRTLVRAQSGDYFNRAELLEDLGRVRTIYRDEGYANVLANPDTKLLADKNEVDVIVPVERGQIVYFDRIEVHGNTKTRDKVIRREMEIFEGKKFSESLLERSRRRITALGYFERVDVATSPSVSPDRLNVEVDVAEKSTGTFQVGAGFSSLEKVIATAQIQQTNLFGNGQDGSLNAQWSLYRQLIDFMLYEPRFMDTMFSVNVNLYNQQRRYSAEFSQSTLGGALTVGYPLIAPELTATLTYTLEDNQISTGQTRSLLGSAIPTTYFQQLPLYNMFNDGITSSIRPSLIIDTRDNRLYPTSGIYLRGSTELSVAELGAQTEFWRNRYTGRFYYPLGAGFVLKLNTEFGLVTSPGKDGVPLFLRFMLGGIMDVRGFEYRSLSPRVPLKASLDDNSPPAYRGSKIGGNMMFYDNLELEFPLFAQLNLKGVFFTDAGNTWNLEQKYCSLDSGARAATSPCFGGLADLLNLRTSYGAGIRWFSPLGPLRFEYGRPFKPLPGEAPGKFEFTIGNFF